MSLQATATLSKQWLIDRLRTYGTPELTPLESPEVNEQNFILVLGRNRYAVKDAFFKELANALGLLG